MSPRIASGAVRVFLLVWYQSRSQYQSHHKTARISSPRHLQDPYYQRVMSYATSAYRNIYGMFVDVID
jgi:hypothetical protein